MGGHVIEQTATYKYLGVIFDENLNWEPQISKMCSKLASVCGVLSKVRHILDRNSLMMIYNSLVESRLRYGIFGWSTASNCQLNRLKTLQNRALRYIDFSPIHTTILPIYSQFNVLPLNKMIDLERANYMFSLSNGLLPTVFRSYCVKPSHRYETRYSKSNFSIAPYVSKISESSIKVIGPKIWAQVPDDFKSAQFRKTFSKHLKRLYLSELPSEKRTKNLIFKKGNNKELEEIFNTSDQDSTFVGFDVSVSLPAIFEAPDIENFLGFDVSVNLSHIFEAPDIDTFLGFDVNVNLSGIFEAPDIDTFLGFNELR